MKKEGKIYPLLLWTSLMLLAFGLISLASVSWVLSDAQHGTNYWYLGRQILLGAIPGLVLMYTFSKTDYHLWQKFSPLLMLIGLVLLTAVFIPGIGFSAGGARRWINFGHFLFQPAELVKLVVIFYLASWYDKRQHNAHDLYYGFLPTLTVVAIVSILIVLEPDMGTMLVLASVATVMFWLGGVKFRYLASAAAVGSLCSWVAIKAAPYRVSRLLAFFDPNIDTRGISYQINQALLAIGSGGFWGRGYGQSLQKYNYLPETIGDSIFAVISEELGFGRVTVVLAAFLLLAWAGYKIAVSAPDTFGRLTAAGITSWIVLQALINIGGITALIPLTGIPLPFISYGASAMALNLAGIGIMLNISKQVIQK
jgi:cell division protein FtsW